MHLNVNKERNELNFNKSVARCNIPVKAMNQIFQQKSFEEYLNHNGINSKGVLFHVEQGESRA